MIRPVIEADMSNAAASPIGPHAPESLDARYRVEDGFAVRALLRVLMTRRSLVTLYAEGRLDDRLVARIVQVGANGVGLDVSGQPQGCRALRDSRFAIGVAFPGNVKTQFRLEALSWNDEPVRAVTGGGSGSVVTTVQAPMPTEVYRLERRETFRVRPPVDDAARCVQRIGIGKELRHAIVDVSEGGLSLRLPAAESPPAPGRIWRHCRIEAADSVVIPCELVARNVHDDPSLEGDRRVGFSFHAMTSDALRRVQMYVLDVEKRQRRQA